MQVEIQDVNEHKDRSSGNFYDYKNGRCKITVSLKRNKEAKEYASTVLHELLHLFFTLIRMKGFIETKYEHAFIYEVEREVKKIFKRYFKWKN